MHNSANRIIDEIYFVTTTVVDWVDIFTRPKYKHIIVDSLVYCLREKGLKVYAWVLMTNHLHMIVSTAEGHCVADIMRDFKKFTSRQVAEALENDLQESRREWILDRMRFAAARKPPWSCGRSFLFRPRPAGRCRRSLPDPPYGRRQILSPA